MTTTSSGLRITNLYEVSAVGIDHAVPMHGADATGLNLHTNGHLGADMVWVPAGARFPVHVHPGDHLLLCLSGHGTITINEITYDVHPGDLYMVDGNVPHAVGAGDTDHVLVAIGAPHKPVDSPERMDYTDWAGNLVAAPHFHDRAADRP